MFMWAVLLEGTDRGGCCASAKDETIRVDRKEIFIAQWFDISTMLEQWRT